MIEDQPPQDAAHLLARYWENYLCPAEIKL